METAEETKFSYELGFLVSEEGQTEDVKRLINQHQGTIVSEGHLKRIQLAYKIKKQTSAFFGYFHIEMEKDGVSAMQKDIKLAPGILRSLIIANPPAPFLFKKQTGSPKDAAAGGVESAEPKTSAAGTGMEALPLSNEDLEKKIEEILK